MYFRDGCEFGQVSPTAKFVPGMCGCVRVRLDSLYGAFKVPHKYAGISCERLMPVVKAHFVC